MTRGALGMKAVVILLAAVLVIVGSVVTIYFVVDITPPTARFRSERFVHIDETVTFDGGDSSDNRGIAGYDWDFGDGNTGAGETSTHAYSSVGVYTATLTVRDVGGNTATATADVFVSYRHPLSMRLRSDDFENGSLIPSRFTCEGEDVSPKLLWENVPEGTRSFAMTMIDPDAPGGEFIHWLIYDIPMDLRKMDRGVVPQEAEELTNDGNTLGYTGPCPPPGSTHRYIFTLYALDAENLADVSKGNLREVVWVHALDKAVLVGLFQRAAQ